MSVDRNSPTIVVREPRQSRSSVVGFIQRITERSVWHRPGGSVTVLCMLISILRSPQPKSRASTVGSISVGSVGFWVAVMGLLGVFALHPVRASAQIAAPAPANLHLGPVRFYADLSAGEQTATVASAGSGRAEFSLLGRRPRLRRGLRHFNPERAGVQPARGGNAARPILYLSACAYSYFPSCCWRPRAAAPPNP